MWTCTQMPSGRHCTCKPMLSNVGPRLMFATVCLLVLWLRGGNDERGSPPAEHTHEHFWCDEVAVLGVPVVCEMHLSSASHAGVFLWRRVCARLHLVALRVCWCVYALFVHACMQARAVRKQQQMMEGDASEVLRKYIEGDGKAMVDKVCKVCPQLQGALAVPSRLLPTVTFQSDGAAIASQVVAWTYGTSRSPSSKSLAAGVDADWISKHSMMLKALCEAEMRVA